ncbi:MAG: hypothetical protein RL189_1077 [Pseudomonadota bacterium]|jgi:transforming growth factor-beta-induced protein
MNVFQVFSASHSQLQRFTRGLHAVTVVSVVTGMVFGQSSRSVAFAQSGIGAIDESSAEPRSNIGELAIANPQLSTLVSLAKICKLVDFLTNPGANVTLFAPTNEAFKNFIGDGALPQTCSEELKSILLYHVVDEKLNSGDFGVTKAYTTYSYPYNPRVLDREPIEPVFVKSDNSGITVNRKSSVVKADVDATNGVIHIIDDVLLPDLYGTVVDALSKRQAFDSLVKAAVASNLAKSLAVIPDLTIFAPVNEAFAQVGSPSSEVLSKVLLSHVLGSRVRSSQLVKGYQQALTLNGDSLTIFGDMYGFTIFGSGQTPLDAGRITSTDIVTKNGIIHTISEVLIPSNIK